MESPRVFVSYSWSSPEHEKWVLDLATELRENGVDVVLDKWDLKEGDDANAFMEKMATCSDIQKVLIVSDRVYAQKANDRKGGVGTETQIISAEIYGKVEQNKFALVVAEKDEKGKPYLPVYYKSRIYVDLSDDESYHQGSEQLLRFIYDKPLHEKPPIGTTPSFLDENTETSLGTSSLARRAIHTMRTGGHGAYAAVQEYFRTFSENLERFRLEKKASEAAEEQVANSIDEFLRFRDEAIAVFRVLSQHGEADEAGNSLHSFFESLLPYLFSQRGVDAPSEPHLDNLRFVVHELFLYCVACLLKNRRCGILNHLFSQRYLYKTPDGHEEPMMMSFANFSQPLSSMPLRAQRENTGNSLLHAQILKGRTAGTGFRFDDLMQADLLLWLRSRSDIDIGRSVGQWDAVTLVLLQRFAPSFEVFLRAESHEYFEYLRVLLDIAGVVELRAMLERASKGDLKIRRPGLEPLDLSRLMNLDSLDSRP